MILQTKEIQELRDGLEAAERALASCRHLMRKYIPAHDWLPHIDNDIALVKSALSTVTRPTREAPHE